MADARLKDLANQLSTWASDDRMHISDTSAVASTADDKYFVPADLYSNVASSGYVMALLEDNEKTFSASGTDDYIVSMSATLNNGDAGGSDVFRGLKMSITETDASGWDEAYLIDCIVGGSTLFRVTNAGKVGSAAGLTLVAAAEIEWSSTSSLDGTPDLGLDREAAGVLAVTDGSTGRGRLMLHAGAETTPSLTMDGVTNTGFYKSATNVWQFVTAGTKAFGLGSVNGTGSLSVGAGETLHFVVGSTSVITVGDGVFACQVANKNTNDVPLIVNAKTATSVDLMDVQVNGTTQFKITSAGLADFVDPASAPATADGTGAANDWLEIKLGGTQYWIPLYNT